MLTTELDGMREGDVVVIPQMPAASRSYPSAARVAYAYEHCPGGGPGGAEQLIERF